MQENILYLADHLSYYGETNMKKTIFVLIAVSMLIGCIKEPERGEGANPVQPVINQVPPVNQQPTVNAGSDQTITLPTRLVNLDGTVTDDGLPNPPATMTTTWKAVSDPGTVIFGSETATNTTATFSAAGTYVLRLTASDSALQASDEHADGN